MTEMIDWRQKSKLKKKSLRLPNKTEKIPRASQQNSKKFLGFQQNPKKSLVQNLAPKKPHTEFPSLKNDVTLKIKT